MPDDPADQLRRLRDEVEAERLHDRDLDIRFVFGFQTGSKEIVDSPEEEVPLNTFSWPGLPFNFLHQTHDRIRPLRPYACLRDYLQDGGMYIPVL